MAQTMDDAEPTTARVNDLYWSSSRTVDDIVADLGISRSALYSSIEPVPAGLVCADCNERMVYPNRTMRERGVALCPGCGRESAAGPEAAGGGGGTGWEPDGEGEWEAGESTLAPGDEDAATATGADTVFARWTDALRAVTPQRLALVGGAAGLGMVAGAAITRLLRD